MHSMVMLQRPLWPSAADALVMMTGSADALKAFSQFKSPNCLQMNLGEEDLCVLMKILVENIGEGSSQRSVHVNRETVQGRFMHDC